MVRRRLDDIRVFVLFSDVDEPLRPISMNMTGQQWHKHTNGDRGVDETIGKDVNNHGDEDDRTVDDHCIFS